MLLMAATLMRRVAIHKGHTLATALLDSLVVEDTAQVGWQTSICISTN